MPASAMDSVTAALRNNFHKAGTAAAAGSALESELAASAKKSLLGAAMRFDSPVRQLGGAIRKGSSVIFLNPKQREGARQQQDEAARANGAHQGNGHATAPAPTKPKVM